MTTGTDLDLTALRAHFPLLSREQGGRPLVYLDNAATSQKPDVVLEAMNRFYETSCANVHRGVHALSRAATEAYEGARRTMARFVGATDPREIVFTRGATEALNIVAASFSAAHLRPGDRVILSGLEHHSDIVPWQMACDARGASLGVLPVNAEGALDLAPLDALLAPPTKILCLVHVSNALGTLNPIETICARARAAGVRVLVDGAQAAPHLPIDVGALGCDFYTLSGHKMYGPTGTGVLWGRGDLLNALPPFLGGGDMIKSVTFEHTEYAEIPARFEAGTPNIAGAIGLGAAAEFLMSHDRAAVLEHECALYAHMVAGLQAISGVRLVGTAPGRLASQSFLVGDAPAHDVATLIDQHGIAVRSGHHCTQPLMQRLGISGTVRASLGMYNTTEEIDRLLAAVVDARDMLA